MGHNFWIALVAIGASSFIANGALADPLVLGISGEPVNGNTVVVSGLGFGANSSPEPLIWDDFESGSNGIIIAGNAPNIGNAWEDMYTATEQRPQYTSQNQRINSGLSSRHNYENAIGWYSALMYTNENLPKAFMSFWWRYDNTGPVWSRNVKPWMVYGNLQSGNRPMVYVGMADSQGPLRTAVIDIDALPVDADTIWGETILPEIDEQWIRLEAWLELSTPGVADGTFQAWTHRPYASTPGIVLELDSGENQIMTRASTGHWKQWHIGTYMAVDDPIEATGNVQVDDIYISNTRARVEIGNANSWSDVTHREVQIARDWSDNSVSFELNQGGFESIAGKYLYVIDAQGRVNNIGLPLCDDCPLPPSGLSAQEP
jgi:hypothetical protein